jgi:hypothetical protein
MPAAARVSRRKCRGPVRAAQRKEQRAAEVKRAAAGATAREDQDKREARKTQEMASAAPWVVAASSQPDPKKEEALSSAAAAATKRHIVSKQSCSKERKQRWNPTTLCTDLPPYGTSASLLSLSQGQAVGASRKVEATVPVFVKAKKEGVSPPAQPVKAAKEEVRQRCLMCVNSKRSWSPGCPSSAMCSLPARGQPASAHDALLHLTLASIRHFVIATHVTS